MKGRNHGAYPKWRLPGVMAAAVVFMWACASAGRAAAQIPYQTQAGGMILFESGGAARIVEKVRSNTQGVVVAIFVKAGDPVRKGQILGHTALDATKLQLDLARQVMDSKASVDAAESQANAWAVTRQETEVAVRKRKVEGSRLEWAIAMEKMYQAQHEAQLDAKNTQRIHYEHWNQQYENLFFRAPVDGIVSEVLVDVGKPVNHALHLFTIRNDNTFALPVTVPSALAETAVPNEKIPVRSGDGKSVSNAVIDSVTDDPRSAGKKIVRLLIKAADLSATTRANLMGMKFDVLLPQVAGKSSH